MQKSKSRTLNTETLQQAVTILCHTEERFSNVIKDFGIPPLWGREPGFKTLVRIILEQQVSLSSAKAAYDRLQERLTDLNEENFLKLNDAELLSIGFSRQKRSYCRNLARALQTGELILKNHGTLRDDELRSALLKIKGIGNWTVDIYFLMALRRPDIWPRNDIALAQAIQELFQLPVRPGNQEMDNLSQNWRPWRAVAARILWHYYLNRKIINNIRK
jgi:DNA-3-methyladenine glycosylase II